MTPTLLYPDANSQLQPRYLTAATSVPTDPDWQYFTDPISFATPAAQPKLTTTRLPTLTRSYWPYLPNPSLTVVTWLWPEMIQSNIFAGSVGHLSLGVVVIDWVSAGKLSHEWIV